MKYNAFPILLATTFLSTPAMAITLEPTLDDSVISYSEGISTDYNFTVDETDSEGNITTVYYKINLDKDKLSTSSSVSWSEVDETKKEESNVIAVQLPNNQTKYFQYSYSAPNGYSTTSERINNTLSTANVTNIVFTNITSTSNGGAINNRLDNSGVNIKVDFIGNYVSSSSKSTYGGAILNYVNSSSTTATIGNIIGDFIGNYTISVSSSDSADSYGGAIFNLAQENIATIGDITGDFIDNYSSSDSSESSYISFAYGGAIYNNANIYTATIGDIIGDFIGNHTYSTDFTEGGAIYNYTTKSTATIGNITGDFIGNYAYSEISAKGGAIFNYANHGTATIGNITGDFIGNYAYHYVYGSFYSSLGGAIYNESWDGIAAIGNITGDFIGNYAFSYEYSAQGGTIFNAADGGTAIIGSITGDFIGNYAYSTKYSKGGAILNRGTIGNITGDFIENYAKTESTSYLALGGAIYTNQNLTFTSGSDIHFFTGNYTEDKRGKIYNSIFINNSSTTALPVITLDTTGGAWVINDNIEGGKSSSTSVTYNDYDYKLVLTGNDTIDTESGTTTQYINMNNAIINAGDVKVENTTLRFGNYKHEDTTAKNWDGKGKFIATLNDDGSENLDADSVTSLTLNNAVFDISNGYLETIKLKKLTSTENTSNFIHLDVNVEKMESDIINVKGDVDGGTKLIIHATSDKDIRGRGKILFAESFGDTKGGETSFEVARVYKSPYLYDVIYEGVKNTSTPTESKDNTWYFEMNDKENPNKEQAPIDPNPDVPSVDDYIPDDNINAVSTPEVIAGAGLHAAGIEQTRTVVRNVSSKVANARSYCPNCGIISDAWDGKQLRNAWVLAQGEYSNIDKPVDMEAKIWGVEGGFDLQSDMNNTFGVFASYRNGEYDLSGKGTRY
ncbi:MAG: hypothetical protein J6K16_07530, partial [Alphaproteobacteria bacterium]|nr:hypothetical protein [Alphaproteobacteria bacterium]